MATCLYTSRAISVSGVTISFREAGDPAGSAAVLLHGGASSAATWDRLAAALTTAGHHVVAADLRGHGASSRTGDYRLDAYGDDILGLLDALGIESAALVGHSLGGYTAATIAQRHSGRVTRLVLEEPGMPARDADSHDGLSSPRFRFAAVAALATHRRYDLKAVTSLSGSCASRTRPGGSDSRRSLHPRC